MVYTGLVVVIPTRNRAAIAMNAIRSVLDQPVEVGLLVSDNSTSETDREALSAELKAAGFGDVNSTPMTLGIVALHEGTK